MEDRLVQFLVYPLTCYTTIVCSLICYTTIRLLLITLCICLFVCFSTAGCVVQVLVRAHEQFEAFMDSEQFRADHQVLMAVLKTLAKIGPHADPVFRDECKYQYVQLSQYSFLAS